ncbi:MAG: efflux RND transporter periplasmic adaptor subunit [Gammaproteobacteria bacterium]|nr:MAG: efflux RND transporter periplasmic adaptor subunit [Gammaproteobacteria bacterium]
MNRLLVVSLVIVAVLWLVACDGREPAEPAQPAAERRPLYYRNPMDPGITSEVPRKDAMGMDYIPVYADAEPASDGTVQLSPVMINNLGVRTAPVRHGEVTAALRTTAILAFDERSRIEVRARVEGYVEQLAVRATGERVRRGQPLFAIFSPRLAATQHEFVAALAAGDADLLAAARARLQALGLDTAAINRLAAGAAPAQRIVYHAPRDGVVTELGVREGSLIEPGTMGVAILSEQALWAVAAVPERQAGLVRAGGEATITVAAVPGESFTAKVIEVLPALDAATRTLQARLELANPGGRLAAGMIAEVVFAAPSAGHALLVPREALIRTGTEERVVVALGEGRFVARSVVAGRESGEDIEILQGLDGSEQVVASGQFMIDSESQQRSGLARYSEPPAAATQDQHDHGGGP